MDINANINQQVRLAALEAARPPGRAQDDAALHTWRREGARAHLPDQRVRLLLGHLAVQGDHRQADGRGALRVGVQSPGTVPRQVPEDAVLDARPLADEAVHGAVARHHVRVRLSRDVPPGADEDLEGLLHAGQDDRQEEQRRDAVDAQG